MPEAVEQACDEKISVFEYEDEGAKSTSFTLSELRRAVNEHFGLSCELSKMAEGGFHKVYDITDESGRSLHAVVRVAAPAFPKDKMESEVATLKYITEHTTVPVPRVIAWNSDARNPVGAEYMILEKIDGISPFNEWRNLNVEFKLNVVKQVAVHLVSLFSARFEQAGSLYLAEPVTTALNSPDYVVGPIVSAPFFDSLDGLPAYPDISSDTFYEMQKLRGPFRFASDYLSSSPRARLLYALNHRNAALREFEDEGQPIDTANEQLNRAAQVVEKIVELNRIYPGERILHEPSTSPGKPFSFLMDDFRTANLIVDKETGDVRALIDLECATIAPLWECADVPSWIPDPDSDMRNWYGGSPDDQRRLWTAFHDAVADADSTGEWRRAYEAGKPYRTCIHLGLPELVRMAGKVEARLAWAKDHPGVAMPEEEF